MSNREAGLMFVLLVTLITALLVTWNSASSFLVTDSPPSQYQTETTIPESEGEEGDLNIFGSPEENDDQRVYASPTVPPTSPAPSTSPPPRPQGKFYRTAFPSGSKVGNGGLLPGTQIITVTSRNNGVIRYDTCTVAFSMPGKSDMSWAFTAGHCGEVGQKVYSPPTGRDFATAQFLGTVRAVAKTDYNTGAGDWSGIRLYSDAQRPPGPEGIPLQLDTHVRPSGNILCKYGATTKHNCGAKRGEGIKTNLGGFGPSGQTVSAKLDQVELCALPGDSGAPIFDRKGIVGILSSSSANKEDVQRKSCRQGAMAYYTPIRDVVDQIKSSLKDVQLS